MSGLILVLILISIIIIRDDNDTFDFQIFLIREGLQEEDER